MLLQIGLLMASLMVMTLGAEGLVRGAVTIARQLGISSFFIGLTIVGFGTSTPELCTSLAAAWKGTGEIAVGNVIGSNIFNIAVVLGMTALICPIPLKLDIVRREVLVVIAVACLPFVAIATGGQLGRLTGGVMVALLVVYLWNGYRRGRTQNQSELESNTEREIETELATPVTGWKAHPLTSATLIGFGLAMLILGSWLLVQSATSIARSLGVSDLVIGLTVVAAGTSAPEFVTSLVAAVRKQPDISVGNILGSNVFNVLGILGLTCVVLPQEVSRQSLMLDLPVMLAVSLACLPIMMSGSRITRAEGALLIVFYAAYAVALFAWAPGWFG
ncbi:MAG: calcium/sodium antiporter [Phycisphaerales bacterium JB058]